MILPSLKRFLLLVLIGCFSIVAAQFTVPKKPAVLYPVYDESGILSATEEDVLNQKLIKFADSTSTEIGVIIIPTTNGEDINHVAWQFGEAWKLGQKDVDNGIVFLIATEDRTMSIQQGRAVEQYLTASVAGQIIDYIVAPNFKQGLWYEGINRGTTALMETVQGKFQPIKRPNRTGESELGFFEVIMIAFLVLFILSFIFRNRGGNNRGGDDDDDVILSRRGRRTYPGGFFPFPTGGFGGGGFGGGGFGGGGGGFGGFGGGGSFGGGGASGGW